MRWSLRSLLLAVGCFAASYGVFETYEAAPLGGLSGETPLVSWATADGIERTAPLLEGVTSDGSVLVTLTASGDQTAAIATATANLLSRHPAGGILRFPPGTYDVCGAILRSGVRFVGAGDGQTTLRKADGCAGPAVATEDFAALTGSNSCAAPHGYGLEDIRLSGNSTGRTSGYVFQGYGYAARFTNASIRDVGRGGGFYHEYTTAACGTAFLAVESHMIGFDVFGDGAGASGDLVDFAGPHDSQWSNSIFGWNGAGSKAFDLLPGGSGLMLANVHAFTGVGSYAWYMQAPFVATNLYTDGGRTGGVMIGADGSKIDGLWGSASGIAQSGACLEIGDETHLEVSQTTISGYLYSCGDGGAVKFASDAGNSRIDLTIYQPAGRYAHTGSPHATTDYCLNLNGGGSLTPGDTASAGGRCSTSQPHRWTKPGTFTQGLATTSLSLSSLADSAVAPTVGGGFCEGSRIEDANGSAGFVLAIGRGACSSTGTLSMPKGAAHGWSCVVGDLTTPAADAPKLIGTTPGTVTLGNHAQVGGAVKEFSPGNRLLVSCRGM